MFSNRKILHKETIVETAFLFFNLKKHCEKENHKMTHNATSLCCEFFIASNPTFHSNLEILIFIQQDLCGRLQPQLETIPIFYNLSINFRSPVFYYSCFVLLFCFPLQFFI